MNDPIKAAFYRQWYRAINQRNLEFSFTYKQWVAWWLAKLGPNWFELRGPKPDQYCMARKGDKGPYEPSNVDCKTNAENRREQRALGRAKLDETKVRFIRRSNLSDPDLAKKFNVHINTIWRCRNGLTW